MKKTLLTTALLLAAFAGMAQTKPKQYAPADPNKLYTFTLTIKAVNVFDLQELANHGSIAIMDTNIPAKVVKTIANNSAEIINGLLTQLRSQIFADSLANAKGRKP